MYIGSEAPVCTFMLVLGGGVHYRATNFSAKYDRCWRQMEKGRLPNSFPVVNWEPWGRGGFIIRTLLVLNKESKKLGPYGKGACTRHHFSPGRI